MIDIYALIARADAYKIAANVTEDTTVSYRVFADSKKLSALRNGGDITVRRFNAAMRWFDQNWPECSAVTSNNESSHDQSQNPDAA